MLPVQIHYSQKSTLSVKHLSLDKKKLLFTKRKVCAVFSYAV